MVLTGSSLELLGNGLVWECGVLGRGVLGLVWSFWIAEVIVFSAHCKRDSTHAVSSSSVPLSMICSALSSDWLSSDPSEVVFAWVSVSEVLGLLK